MGATSVAQKKNESSRWHDRVIFQFTPLGWARGLSGVPAASAAHKQTAQLWALAGGVEATECWPHHCCGTGTACIWPDEKQWLMRWVGRLDPSCAVSGTVGTMPCFGCVCGAPAQAACRSNAYGWQKRNGIQNKMGKNGKEPKQTKCWDLLLDLSLAVFVCTSNGAAHAWILGLYLGYNTLIQQAFP